MSVAQRKAAARRIKLRYPPPRRKLGAVDYEPIKKGQKINKR